MNVEKIGKTLSTNNKYKRPCVEAWKTGVGNMMGPTTVTIMHVDHEMGQVVQIMVTPPKLALKV